jgi:hypothetical protein
MLNGTCPSVVQAALSGSASVQMSCHPPPSQHSITAFVVVVVVFVVFVFVVVFVVVVAVVVVVVVVVSPGVVLVASG